MEIHAPVGKVRSIKDFLIHLALIVLGILIAVSLDSWRESRKHAEIGQAMVDAMKKELATNLRELNRVSAENVKASAAIKASRDANVQAMAKARAERVSQVNIPDQSVHLKMAILTTAAWDAAVATNSLQYVQVEKIQAFAMAYSLQRDYSQFQTSALQALASAVDHDENSKVDLLDAKRLNDMARTKYNTIEIIGFAARHLANLYVEAQNI